MEDHQKFYAFIDGEQKGPYRLEELAGAGVRPSTYVWTKGMPDWQKAEEVPEICRLFRQHLAHRMHPETVESPTVISPQGDTTAQGQPYGPPPGDENNVRKDAPRSRFGIPLPETEPEPDYNRPPQVSLMLAFLSLFLCFPPSGIAAVFFTYRSLKYWQQSLVTKDPSEVENLRKQSHEAERLSKMWLGLTVAFGLIFWTVLLSKV